MTTIHVKEKVWKKLNALKNPGESMNDVVEKILNFYERKDVEMYKNTVDPKIFDRMLDEFCKIASEDIERVIEGSRMSFKKDL